MANQIKDQLDKQPNGKKEKSKEEEAKENALRAKRAAKANDFLTNGMQEEFIKEFGAMIELKDMALMRGIKLVPLTQGQTPGTVVFGIEVPMNGARLSAKGLTDEEKTAKLKEFEDARAEEAKKKEIDKK